MKKSPFNVLNVASPSIPRPLSPPLGRQYYEEAEVYEKAKDYEKAAQAYQKGANIGHTRARSSLGFFFLAGRGGCARDPAKAYELLNQSAEEGHPRAMRNLANQFRKGYGVPKDEEAAQRWEERAKEIEENSSSVNCSVVSEPKFCNSANSSSSSNSSILNDAFSQFNFYISSQDITLGNKLGAGGFGEVFEGDRHGEKVAVKQLLSHKMSEDALNEFKKEVAIMASLHFEYIVTFKGVCVEPYCLVMEYMSGGSLFGVLHSPTMLPWSTRHRIAWDVAKGLAFLHRQKPIIIHRDLKSHNVLLTADYQCAKLTDFGISSIRKESATFTGDGGGSFPWMAPECFESHYSIKSDIYAYGMVLWELVSRKTPYEKLEMQQICYKVAIKGECEDISNEMTQLSPDRPTAKTPQSIKDFIGQCWFKESAQRPTAKRAVEAFEQDIERELAPEYSDHENVQMTSAEGKESESPQRRRIQPISAIFN